MKKHLANNLSTILFVPELRAVCFWHTGSLFSTRHYILPLTCQHCFTIEAYQWYTFTITRALLLSAGHQKFLTLIDWGHLRQITYTCVVMYLSLERRTPIGLCMAWPFIKKAKIACTFCELHFLKKLLRFIAKASLPWFYRNSIECIWVFL